MAYIDSNEPGTPMDSDYDAAVSESIRRKGARVEAQGRQHRIRSGRATFDDLLLAPHRPDFPDGRPGWKRLPSAMTPQDRTRLLAREAAGRIELARTGGAPYAYREIGSDDKPTSD